MAKEHGSRGRFSAHRAGRRCRGPVGAGAAALLLAASGAPGQSGNYLLLVGEAPVTNDQLRSALMATGVLGNVDIYPSYPTIPTPTLAQLLQYNAVLTYSNSGYVNAAAMGDLLADYVDLGGGVVLAVYTVSSAQSTRALGGRWASGGYEIIPARSGETSTATSLGTVPLPGHPLWAGMTGFSGATNYTRATTLSAAPHAVRVANWASGGVLAATSSLYPARVDLNFFPTPWMSTPHGARLLANALVVAGMNSNLNTGACCFVSGACSVLAGTECLNQGGTFRGPDTTCAAANCPQFGACCHPDGSCTTLHEAPCIAAGGTWRGAHIECWQANCPQPQPGACCTLAGCALQTIFQCLPQMGVFRGENTTCTAAACADLQFEQEPNNTRAEANLVILPVGHSIVGLSTGATGSNPGNADYFRVQTQAAPPGIYRHRLTLRGQGSVAGPAAFMPGLAQSAATAGPWPGPVGTATTTEEQGQVSATEGLSRLSTWYGFGRGEEVFYRVVGNASTITAYIATLETQPVTPTDIGTFQAGVITISTAGMGHTNDTSLRIYNSALQPVHGFANDNATINGGAPANSGATSHLQRQYEPGVYFIGLTLGALATSHGAPCDDGIRNRTMLALPDAAVSVGQNGGDISFRVIDGAGTRPVSASRGASHEMAWFRFTVTGAIPTGACCFESGACQDLTAVNCSAQGGAFRGLGTACATESCPQPGACCLFLGCQVLSAAQCAEMLGQYRGNGTMCPTATPPCTTGAGVMMAIPPFQSTLSGGVARGVWFTAPTDFVITGLRVPDEAQAGLQNVEVVRLDAPPPFFAATTSSFVSLARHTGVPSAVVIPVNIPIASGQIIGILATCGNATTQHNSQGSAGPFETSILGHPAMLRRFGMQFNLTTTPAQNVWQAAGDITRVEIYHAPPPQCYANCDQSTVAPVLNVDDFTCFINAYAGAQFLPHEQQVQHYANCDGSTFAPVLNVDDFTCFINRYAQGCS
jgi:hypothetical protein